VLIKMGTINNLHQMGWYGSCGFEQECEDFYMVNLDNASRENLDSVVRTHDISNGRTFTKFTAYDLHDSNIASKIGGETNRSVNFDSYFNYTFESMECGSGYTVHLSQSRNSSGASSVEIENFNVADGTSFVSNDCSNVVASPCTTDGYLSMMANSTNTVEITGVATLITKDIQLEGTFFIPPRDSSASYLPKSIDVSIDGGYFATITYNGDWDTSMGSIIYFKTDTDLCYSGAISSDTNQVTLTLTN